MRRLLNAGADKVSINTAAVQNPQLVRDASSIVGNQCIVVAIDAKKSAAGWEVYTHGGRRATGIDVVQWAKRMADAGAGEILLTSMDRDGTRDGFDLALTRAVADAVSVPVIASGGVGSVEHLADGVLEGRADAVLAASVFHFGDFTVRTGEGAHAHARHRGAPMSFLDEVPWNGDGLIAAVAQDAYSGRVLTVAWMNRDALRETAEKREAVYWSRSRKRLWRKGEESGHVQKVRRGAPRLRRRRGAAQGGAGRRHRLPHRPRELLLPQTREWEMDRRSIRCSRIRR